jgi:hypothetical protein
MVLEIKPVRSFWLECKKALTDTQGFVDNFSGGTDDKCQRKHRILATIRQSSNCVSSEIDNHTQKEIKKQVRMVQMENNPTEYYQSTFWLAEPACRYCKKR